MTIKQARSTTAFRRRSTGARLTPLSRVVIAILGVAMLVGACGGDNPSNADSGNPEDTAAADDESDGTPYEDASWEEVVPGGDCLCADGSDYKFWDRRADPEKVVLFLEGGGVCTDAVSCAFTGEDGESEDYYPWNLSGEDPENFGGILDFGQEDNPFADSSFIYASLCTGDHYLGNTTHEYAADLTVEHKGYNDGMAALNYLAEHYPDAEQVVVVGKTDGAYNAPVYGGLAADLLPDADVTVFAAQSGAYIDDPDFNADKMGKLWGATDTMPDWEVNEDLKPSEWGFTNFWIQVGLHNPDITMARFDYAYDPNAAKYIRRATGKKLTETDLLPLIEANEAAVEDAGVNVHSYVAPGEGHGVFEGPFFYGVESNGVRLVDWLADLVEGESVDDVRP